MLQENKVDLEPYLGRAREARSLHEVGVIAAELLREHYPKGAGIVIGPIVSGGIIVNNSPCFRANLKALEHKIDEIAHSDKAEVEIFNYLIFRPFVDKYRREWREKKDRNPREFYEPLLHDFYGTILGTGLISVGYFMHGWKRDRSGTYVYRALTRAHSKVVEV